MNVEKRVKMVKAMEYISSQINEQYIYNSWRDIGVENGDIAYGDLTADKTAEGVMEWYIDDDVFADLMDTFLHCMAQAKFDGGLYCDGVVSKEVPNH